MLTPKKAASAKSALSKPVQPDAALAAVVGKDPLPRTELTKKLWEYIRKHELQDPKEKRNIRADERLLAVLLDGGKDSGKKHTDRRITSRSAIMKTPGAAPRVRAIDRG